jgi:ribonuclease D
MREKIAMRQNMIRNKVLSDDVLVAICERRPQSVADLRLMKLIKSEDIAQYGQDIIQIVCNILEQPVLDTPVQNTNITLSQERLIGFITLYIKQISEDTHISMRILAQQNEIWDCAVTGNAGFMNDWRYELFGKNIHAIMQGKKSLAFIAGKVVLLDNDL